MSRHTKQLTPPVPASSNGRAPATVSHNVVLCFDAVLRSPKFSRCVVIGDGASDPTKDEQLIIKFESGREMIVDLPEGEIVDLRVFRRMQQMQQHIAAGPR